MPNYDYKCDDCGHLFEVFQSMKDASLKECPQCKKQTLRRLIGSGAGIIFKGSGFYETDYKRSKGPAEGSSGSSKEGAPPSVKSSESTKKGCGGGCACHPKK